MSAASPFAAGPESAAALTMAPDLQGQLAQATASARDAYRDTTRLIRLLSVLGQPAGPEELVDQTLTVLSEVFFAEVTMVAHLLGTRLVVTGACGLPEDDPAFRDGLPTAYLAAEALRTAQVVARNGLLDPVNIPGSVARLGIRSAAWIPLSTEGDGEDLLILMRCSSEPFTPSDLQVLSSVAYRLRLAVEERERSAVIEQLARYGHRLAQHLELDPLLDEAVELLRGLANADQAWVVSVEGGQAQLRAHRGLTGADLEGWPRPIGAVDQDRPVVRPRPYLVTEVTGATGAALVTGLTAGAGAGVAADALAAGARGMVLQVPVVRDGALAALLFAARARPRPFARDTTETAAIFANYLAVAMVNAELYGTLRSRATQDPLTGLANRTLVNQRLDAALDPATPARRGRSNGKAQVGVLFCDLDRFKAVNDLLGHEAGDELLQLVAHRLRCCVRPGDVLARFGGDEFVVVLEGVRDLAEVAEVGLRLSRELDHEFVVRGERMQVSVSVGGVLGTPGQSTASAMLRDADAAMYVAKERGLGQVEVFDEAASHRALHRLDLRSELARALDRGQLHVRYQPIVALDSGRLVAFEALLRWDHPRHGSVSPEIFVPLAEDTGTMVLIGQWVLEQACRQLAAWRRLPGGELITISVNLSAGQVRHRNLVEQTIATIRAAGVEPDDVWLEVTEHSYLHHDVTASAVALRAAGVHFALDDFGTAYSSLSYLRRFPIESLKIDRSFVGGGTTGETDQSIVRAIVAIADSLNLTTVAEGIETDDQRRTLLALGCRLGQGNLLSPPLVPEEATRFLQATAPTAPAPAHP
jgi:diguanylate cyclase (GGDEF)-like protein